jgi:hypothetical protein
LIERKQTPGKSEKIEDVVPTLICIETKKNSTGAVKTAAATFKGEEVAFSPGEKTPEPSPHPDTVRRYP